MEGRSRDMTCDGCKQRDGRRQICEGDFKVHWHGEVHTADGALVWLCDGCMAADKAAWDAKRTVKA